LWLFCPSTASHASQFAGNLEGSDPKTHMPFVAEPTYENGELQHGGSDLDLKGSLPYYAVEVIYCLALLQILTAVLSDKFWWLLLAVRLHKPTSVNKFLGFTCVATHDLTVVAAAGVGALALVAVCAAALFLFSFSRGQALCHVLEVSELCHMFSMDTAWCSACCRLRLKNVTHCVLLIARLNRLT
jgi:hypothetical protein